MVNNNNDVFNLSGKTALITGASRGIGAASAYLLSQYGAHVILTSRSADGCDATAQRITEAGGSAETMQCHIGRLEDIESCFKQIEQNNKQLHILVNNAAANPYFGPILDTPLDAYQKTFDVNVRGYFYCSIAASKIMRKNNGGSIVNISSIGGVRASNMQGVYSITKAAIIHMTKCFAVECGVDKIRINAVLPGLTETKFAKALFDNKKIYQHYTNQTPLGRHAQPEEIANAVLYFASAASNFATGETLILDGGVTL